MDIILIQPQSKDQVKAFEQMAKALKVPFQIRKENPYKPEFVAMVKQADMDYNPDGYREERQKNKIG